jgi:hypothetical protein
MREMISKWSVRLGIFQYFTQPSEYRQCSVDRALLMW